MKRTKETSARNISSSHLSGKIIYMHDRFLGPVQFYGIKNQTRRDEILLSLAPV